MAGVDALWKRQLCCRVSVSVVDGELQVFSGSAELDNARQGSWFGLGWWLVLVGGVQGGQLLAKGSSRCLVSRHCIGIWQVVM